MKRTALITLIAIATLCLGVLATYFLLFTPSAHAQRTADRIMQSAYTQDDAAFQSYADPASSELYSAASQRNYRFISLTQEDAAFHALYTFTDSQQPSHARITIKNRAVSDMSIGSPLGATPNKDPKLTTSSNSTDTCLSQSDLRALDSTRLYAKIIRGATMIFDNTTTIEYVHAESSEEILARMLTFYEGAQEKDFSFLLRGYVPFPVDKSNSQYSTAQNRATKIKNDLVDKGIPLDRIDIGNHVAYNQEQSNEDDNEHYIIIDIVNNCID